MIGFWSSGGEGPDVDGFALSFSAALHGRDATNFRSLALLAADFESGGLSDGVDRPSSPAGMGGRGAEDTDESDNDKELRCDMSVLGVGICSYPSDWGLRDTLARDDPVAVEDRREVVERDNPSIDETREKSSDDEERDFRMADERRWEGREGECLQGCFGCSSSRCEIRSWRMCHWPGPGMTRATVTRRISRKRERKYESFTLLGMRYRSSPLHVCGGIPVQLRTSI